MMKSSKKLELKEKGWNDREIKRAETILEKSEKHELFYSKMVFWTTLVVIIFGNLLVSIVLIPFVLLLNRSLVYVIVAILAACIGFLYNFLINDIGHLERKHHLLAGIILPVLAIGNMILMVMASNKFLDRVEPGTLHYNFWTVSAIFVIAFILPYLLDRIRLGLRERKAVLVR